MVGVVGDTKDGGLDAEPRGALFQPIEQEAMFGGGLVIRSQRDPATLAPAATRIVRSIVPNDPIENVLTIGQIKDQSVAPRRLNAVLVSSFGVLAVIIAAVGIAGVLAFSVSARTNEIGIRMSLGADSARVQRMVLAEGGILLVVWTGAGGRGRADRHAADARPAVRRRAERSDHAGGRGIDDGGGRGRRRAGCRRFARRGSIRRWRSEGNRAGAQPTALASSRWTGNNNSGGCMAPKIVYWGSTAIVAVALLGALSYLTGSEQVVSGFASPATRSTSG